jgi:hypothetical protein
VRLKAMLKGKKNVEKKEVKKEIPKFKGMSVIDDIMTGINWEKETDKAVSGLNVDRKFIKKNLIYTYDSSALETYNSLQEKINKLTAQQNESLELKFPDVEIKRRTKAELQKETKEEEEVEVEERDVKLHTKKADKETIALAKKEKEARLAKKSKLGKKIKK